MQAFPNEFVYATSFEFSNIKNQNQLNSLPPIYKIDNYFQNPINLMWTSIVVVDKDCFRKVGFFNETLIRGEDKDMWARLGSNYPIVKSRYVTAVYRLEAENRSNKPIDVKRTFEGNINLGAGLSIDEYLYYRLCIINKIKSCLLHFDISGLLYLLKRYNFKLICFRWAA